MPLDSNTAGLQVNAVVTPQAPKSAQAVTTAAKITYNDLANAVELLTAGARGARLTRLAVTPRATVTATMLQLYVQKGGAGDPMLIATKLMSAHTVATTTAIPSTDFGFSDSSPLILGPSDKLYVGAAVALASGHAWTADYADY